MRAVRDRRLLARIVAPHFVAGIVLEGTTVVEAAPIVRYMVGWSAKRVHAICLDKKWTIARVLSSDDLTLGSEMRR